MRSLNIAPFDIEMKKKIQLILSIGCREEKKVNYNMEKHQMTVYARYYLYLKETNFKVTYICKIYVNSFIVSVVL